MSDSKEIEVLLHESDHVQQAIGRAVGTIYALFGVVLPAVFGAILVVVSKESPLITNAYIGLILSSIVSLAIIYANSLWAESIEFMHYKYVQLHPRIYQAISKSNWENFMQFMKRTRKKESWIPALLFQSTVLFLTFAYSNILVLTDKYCSVSEKFILIALSVGVLGIAIYSSNHVKKHWITIVNLVQPK
jgi:hypothetical protein